MVKIFGDSNKSKLIQEEIKRRLSSSFSSEPFIFSSDVKT
jgi:hypothetical protein